MENEKLWYVVNTYSGHEQKVKEKIEASLKYPGTIKITVIRETRATEEAK